LKSIDRDTKSPRKFCRTHLLHESPFILSRYFHWQSINAATVDGRKTMSNAS